MIKINQLLEFENKYNFINDNVLGFNYWDYIRMNVFYSIKSAYNNSNSAVDYFKRVPLKDKKIQFSNLMRYFITNKHKDILFVTDPRRCIQGDHYESVFVDKIKEYIDNDFSSMVLEEPNWAAWGYGVPAHFNPVNTTNIYYTDFIEITFKYRKLIFKIMKKNEYNKICEVAEDIVNKANNYFKIDISNDIYIFIDLMLYFYLMQKIYTRKIMKINPRIIILNYRPTKFKVLINSIGRKLKIPTVDLQHGVISKEEPLDRKIINGDNWLSTSDYLFAFGEKLVNTDNLAFKKESIKYIGYAFLESKTKEQMRMPDFFEKDIKYLLVISQSIIGESFANFTANLSDLLINNNMTDYKIIFKYHPNELTRDYQQLKKDNIIILKDLKYEIYQLQKYSFAQIGSYSTGLYEGIKFMLPTIVIRNMIGASDTEEILNFIQTGFYKINSPEELVDLLKNGLEKPSENDVKLIWTDHCLEKAKENIIEILKKKIN